MWWKRTLNKHICQLLWTGVLSCGLTQTELAYWILKFKLKFLRTQTCPNILTETVSILLYGNSIPPFVARQCFDKHVPAAKNTSNNRTIAGRVFLLVYLCSLLSFLRWNSVQTFPRQWRMFEDVVFYAIRVVSKQTKWLVLPRTYCVFYFARDKCVTYSSVAFWNFSMKHLPYGEREKEPEIQAHRSTAYCG
jgi:hypothetical protein